jgi:drug/metabolite transporter (DMT)-like permease
MAGDSHAGERSTSEKKADTTQGYFYAIIGAVAAGSVPSLGKILLVDNGPVTVTGLSFVLSGVMLLFYKPKVRPAKRSLPFLVFFGLIGAGLAPLMYTTGLNQTTAVNASLLANGEVLFTTIIAFGAFGERLTRGQAGRGLLIIAGLIAVSTNFEVGHLQLLEGLAGNLLILGATVGWAVENNLIVMATKKFNVASLSKFRNLIGGATVSAIIVVAGIPVGLTTWDLEVLILLALAMSGATYLFIAAVKRLGAIRMFLVWSSSTVFGALFALVLLGEQITLVQVLGGALILSGVYLFHRGEVGPEAEPFTPPAGASG